MGTDPFFYWIGYPDPLFILLCDPFPDTDHDIIYKFN